MPHEPALYAQIIRLARSGSPDRAWALLEESGLAAAHADPHALTLKARLVKDRAKRATGSDAARLFAEASAIYEQAAVPGRASYPLINAASLSLLAGKHERVAQLARQVLELLDVDPDEAETPYWLGATRSEALLLLGRLPEAEAALRSAVAEAPQAWEDRAATIGQFALLCEELACGAGWLDQFRPPRSVQFGGSMAVRQNDPDAERRIADWLEAENVGFGFGALAAGADIWVAEALLARGASLNIVLPCPVDLFRDQSVAAVDAGWLARFDRLLDLADSVDGLDTASAPSPAAVDLNETVSLGLAIHNARILQSEPLRLRIAGAAERVEPSQVRLATIAAVRQSGAGGFDVQETGVAKAMMRTGTGGVKFFDSPGEAWAAARSRTAGTTGVALDYRFVADETDPGLATSRLNAIFDVTEVGQAMASKALAFALLAESPQTRVETMGEIRSAGGFFPIYALADR